MPTTTTQPATEATEPKLPGLTSPEFTGVSLPTLRAWARYWANEKRSKDDPAITADRPRAKHLSLITAEIEAREAAKKA